MTTKLYQLSGINSKIRRLQLLMSSLNIESIYKIVNFAGMNIIVIVISRPII